MRIQHNIMAMNAYRNYNNNTKALSKNLERLSSGYKINRAGDDAAGLAISEKMRAQITGLEAAQKNVKDGTSLVNTAEGAMQEIQDMLNRMVYLATQSSNGTYDNDVDRKNLQQEVDQLRSEINRIADSANFNGIKLLDGSLDSTVSTTTMDFADDGVLPAVVTGKVGTGTILHSTAANADGGTSFSVDLHNTTFANAKDGDRMTLKIGDNELTLVSGEKDANGNVILESGKALGANEIADALVKKYGGNLKIDGQDFEISKGTDGNGDVRLNFLQKNPPKKASEEVNPSKEVTITGDGVGGSFGSAGKAGFNGELDTAVAVTDGTVDCSGLDAKKLAAVIESLGLNAEQDDKVTIANNAGELQIKVGSNVVAKTSANPTFTAAGTDTIEFFAVDENGDVTDTSVGTITTKADATKTIAAASLNGKEVGLTYEDGKPAVLEPPTNVTITPSNASTDAVKTKYTIDLTGLDVDKAATLTFKIGEKTYDVEITQAEVADAANNPIEEVAAAKLADALTKDSTLNLKDGDATFGITATGATVEFESDTNNVAADDKYYALDLGQGIEVSVKANPSGDSAYADYNKSTTNQTTVTVDSSSNRLASTYWTLDKSMVKDGAKVTIGGEDYTFTSDIEKQGAEGYVYIGDLKGSSDLAAKAAERLTEAAKGNATWTVGNDGNRMTFTEIKNQTEYVDADGKSSLTTKNAIAETFGYTGVEAAEGVALTLQIGDTSDSYNQLSVSVGDMHTKALGIDGINIGTQAGAQAAVDIIKNAINQVSSVRGTLGAISNRLDHTANNLSVMAENIQDAESSIRDTDIANEMMSYTKNNILVQSAQAMLAQANQVPQGVLQLLQ